MTSMVYIRYNTKYHDTYYLETTSFNSGKVESVTASLHKKIIEFNKIFQKYIMNMECRAYVLISLS